MSNMSRRLASHRALPCQLWVVSKVSVAFHDQGSNEKIQDHMYIKSQIKRCGTPKEWS